MCGEHIVTLIISDLAIKLRIGVPGNGQLKNERIWITGFSYEQSSF